MRRPIPKTNQKVALEKPVPLKPDELSVFVKTKLADWW
jgi:hypothetical protein